LLNLKYKFDLIQQELLQPLRLCQRSLQVQQLTNFEGSLGNEHLRRYW
jgi:hypothetical protein